MHTVAGTLFHMLSLIQKRRRSNPERLLRGWGVKAFLLMASAIRLPQASSSRQVLNWESALSTTRARLVLNVSRHLSVQERYCARSVPVQFVFLLKSAEKEANAGLGVNQAFTAVSALIFPANKRNLR